MGKSIIWSLKDLMEVIFRCMLNKYDIVIFIDGKRGMGKSTLAYSICSRIPNFKPKHDIVFQREEVNKHLARKWYSVIFADEMINVAHNRDFYLQDQKDLIKQINMYRDHCNLFVGCIPFFMRLDTQLLDLCKIRITVIKRGIAIIQTQLTNLYSGDPWDIRNNQKVEQLFGERKKVPYNKLTTYKGVLFFKDLKPNQRELYEQIKDEKRNLIMKFQEEQEKKDIAPEGKLLKLLKEGKIKDKQEFSNNCIIAGLSYENAKNKINKLLKDEGTFDKTFVSFFPKPIKEKPKKEPKIIVDRLGFIKQ